MNLPTELYEYVGRVAWENMSKMQQLELVNMVITDLFMADGELTARAVKKICELNAVRKLIIADWIKDPKGDD